ncbi:cytochrome b561 domain-containing protein At2g30890-like [Phoenix dactylifera]|uniref:Cytochrome b561 domain-containing protein At2g30890-like n=1 Tax=Phoenix dactylifera TaxID=42345 RepID=A0A8B9ALB8_PHODC|nr:cytochrome b561 domain-containing protein At2g30890-like [Phoenix dactylifera]
MLALERGVFLGLASLLILILLTPLVNSSRDPHKPSQSHKTRQQNQLKLTPELSFQITLHAFLLWASIGFLMPIGIIIIRISNRVECGKKLKVLFYSHVIVQMIATLLATAGAVLAIMNFENSFSNTHQRTGLALHALIWIQPLIGFLRPRRGVKLRSIWYFVHWLLGIGIPILGIINIYIGLHTYHERTSRSVRLWTVLFTAEIVIIAFIYLFQDRRDYMMKQGVILGDEQIRPTDHITVQVPARKS